MEKPKSQTSEKNIREFMVKVRMSEVELAMLDTICSIEHRTRSDVIRRFIVYAIHNYYEEEINEHKDMNEYLEKLFDAYDMLDIFEEIYPSDDEIDNEMD